MTIFKVEQTFKGAGIDLMLDVGSFSFQHSGGFVLKGTLTSDETIDYAIDQLHRDLEALRASAKEKLKSLRR